MSEVSQVQTFYRSAVTYGRGDGLFDVVYGPYLRQQDAKAAITRNQRWYGEEIKSSVVERALVIWEKVE